MSDIISFIIWLGIIAYYNYIYNNKETAEPLKCDYSDNITLCE